MKIFYRCFEEIKRCDLEKCFMISFDGEALYIMHNAEDRKNIENFS